MIKKLVISISENFEISHWRGLTELKLEDVDVQQILSQIPMSHIINFYNNAELLDVIGVEECKIHFNLEDDD